ncbi:hypothetical protein VNI00_005871 [Paramarasmius palmivorus]|uniref:Uncharacterized protein n=1 Tax=Paramarasmius palmivorus TaxID=297713 RepID=A0AAW0DAL9_9AGAR
MPLNRFKPPYIARQHGDDDDDDDDDGPPRRSTYQSGSTSATGTSPSGGSVPTNDAALEGGGKRGANGGAIAGGVIGALIAVGVLVFAFIWLRRRMQRRGGSSGVSLDSEFLVEHKNRNSATTAPSSPGAGALATAAAAVASNPTNNSPHEHATRNMAHDTLDSSGTRTSRQIMTVANPDDNADSSRTISEVKTAYSGRGRASDTPRKSMEAATPSTPPKDANARTGAPSAWKRSELDIMGRMRQGSASGSMRNDSDNASISSRLSNPYSLFEEQHSQQPNLSRSTYPPTEKHLSAPTRLSADDYPIIDDRSISVTSTSNTDVAELQRRVEALQQENERLYRDAAPPAYQLP